MVVGLKNQLVHHCTLRTNILAGLNTEINVKRVVWEVDRWNGQLHSMLLVHLVTIVKIDTLNDSITMPSDSTLITIQWHTDTSGIHLTKINFNSTNGNEHFVRWTPFINLEYIELNG
jgi:hypothetical protein